MSLTETGRRGTGKDLLAPLGVAAVTGAVVTVVGTIDPNQPGHYPTCPFLWITGLYCPGCGTLRTIHALAHFDVVGALSMNSLMVACVPFLVFWWARWMVAAIRGKPRSNKLAHPAYLWAFLAIVLAYWVVRNLPFGAFLAPH
ncbi:MAG: DUF2752 domain-containing protein [Nonomuraea sp.]|nr:DUF2752 domain-containing protein [Nonomuraea sp.]